MAHETKKRLLLAKWEIHRERERDHDAEIETRDQEIEQLEAALTDVKYWLHDGLVMHRIVLNPRQLLRKVEDALG